MKFDFNATHAYMLCHDEEQAHIYLSEYNRVYNMKWDQDKINNIVNSFSTKKSKNNDYEDGACYSTIHSFGWCYREFYERDGYTILDFEDYEWDGYTPVSAIKFFFDDIVFEES